MGIDGIRGAGPRIQATERAESATQPGAATVEGDAPARVEDEFMAGPLPREGGRLSGKALRAAAQLASATAQLSTPEELVAQFTKDFAVQQPELFGEIPLPREQQAQRALEFVSPYAEQLATMEVPLEARAELAEAMSEPVLKSQVLDGLVTADTRTPATEVLKELLTAPTPEAVRELAQTPLMNPSAPPPQQAPRAMAPAEEPAAKARAQAREQGAGSGLIRWVNEALDFKKLGADGAVKADWVVAAGVVLLVLAFVIALVFAA